MASSAPESAPQLQEPDDTSEVHLAGLSVSSSQAPWSSWAQVPRDVAIVAAAGPFFLEIFSGTATLTQAVRAAGIPVLPPIDITRCAEVDSPFDVLDADLWSFVMAVIRAGAVRFVHCGTPCNTFSAARKLDGGPPPLRSALYPEGLPELSLENQAMVFLGNAFLARSTEACAAVFQQGGNFSIENPEFSLLWSTEAIANLQHLARAFCVDFDQCEFGAPSMKPTRLLVSHQSFRALHCRCSRSHKHVKLTGKVWSEFFQSWVFRTKLAQVYPGQLCQQFADILIPVWLDQGWQFRDSFRLCTTDRKRPLGQPLKWKQHRQALSALKAEAAGYQLKRGARKPLLHVETEPGMAIGWALDLPHPLCADLSLDQALDGCISSLAQDPLAVLSQRARAIAFWESRALELLPLTDQLISSQEDPYLRRLLRGAPDNEPCQLGTCCHVALYYAMLEACDSVDKFLPDLLLQGFPIVGPIARSRRWGPYDKDQPHVRIEHACSRAWALRAKIVSRVRGVSENLKKIWDATLEDVAEGSTIGPFQHEHEISQLLACEDWIPTQRLEVVQRNKVRGCDSATTNLINQITVITEKLQLPSADSNVAALRKMRSLMPDARFAGWVLDERKAYRQVAIRPCHRKFSVICLKNPSSGKPEFFIMIGHSFGLVSAVYNYNRRSAAINEVLVSLFNLVTFSL